MNLLRFDAAPLLAFAARDTTNYRTETNARIPPSRSADRVSQSASKPQAAVQSDKRSHISRLIRQNGLSVVRIRKHKVTTDRHHTFSNVPNLLGRNFNSDKPDRKHAADISYIRSREGCLYLAVILSLNFRRAIALRVLHAKSFGIIV
jgi:transposase InsO family protein